LRFDDRLATVLDQSAADARGRAVQWRQLVELVARGGDVSPDLAKRALGRIAELMEDLPSDLLAATARAIATRVVPAELVALFAARGASASIALIAEVDLSPEGWTAVKAVAAEDVLPLLAALEPAPARQGIELAPTVEPKVESAPEVVLPAGLFRWEAGPTGEIDWVEGAPRAVLVGRSLVDHFADPFAARLPFADEPLVLGEEGALAGEWRWSGAPAFFADTGRFAGYRGLARREGASPDPGSDAALALVPAEDDGLRELMHELRTPLNAIIGFGEIIEGQYLGPAHRAYRERAAEIVRQARNLSDAVDNLDLAARLRSGRLHGESTSGLDVVRTIVEEVRNEATARQLRLTVEDRAGSARVALPPALAERLVRQFSAAMLEPAIAGERIGIVIDLLDSNLAIGVDRATALRGLSEQQILADRGRAGMRFALRMVQGLAQMTGGRLDIGADRLVMLLPLAR
jgi:signal transduction histidine kinase